MSDNKRILIMSEVFYPEIGSGSNRITNLVMHLKSRGHIVDVITSEPSYPDKDLYEDEKFINKEKEKHINLGSKIMRVKGSKAKVTANFLKRLYIYLFFLFKCIGTVLFSNEKYDLIIPTTPSIFMGILGGVAKFRFKAKYILDIRDLWPECIKNIGVFRRNKVALKLAYSLERFILKFTDAVVVNSEAYKYYLIDKGYKKPIRFIPNGLTVNEFEDFEEMYSSIEKEECFTVIYTGLIGLAQNVTTIVRAANNLRHLKNIKFRIIGTGVQTNKVIKLIKHYKLMNIEVVPPMPKDKVVIEIAKAHVAIVHLRKDSAFDLVIPGKMIDYMGIGIPIVAGVEGYTASILTDSKAGIAIEPDDHKGLANAILHMYSDNYLRESCSNSGKRYCKDHFMADINFSKYDELINELLGREGNDKKDMHVCMESFH